LSWTYLLLLLDASITSFSGGYTWHSVAEFLDIEAQLLACFPKMVSCAGRSVPLDISTFAEHGHLGLQAFLLHPQKGSVSLRLSHSHQPCTDRLPCAAKQSQWWGSSATSRHGRTDEKRLIRVAAQCTCLGKKGANLLYLATNMRALK
jgi:hypothetical protein